MNNNIPVIPLFKDMQIQRVLVNKKEDEIKYAKQLCGFLIENCHYDVVKCLFQVFFKYCLHEDITNLKRFDGNFLSFYIFADKEFDKMLEKLNE